ncbi:MAG TPA: DUF4336 domain-containing protein, partial [Enhygromyxa sp.]|nr:DUF4336 domain-containing protein [Enhygromyxa sp.]
MLDVIAPDLWASTQVLRLPGGLIFQARMTVIRLPSGGLVLHSPIAIDDALAAELATLGEVQEMISPNLMHDGFAVPGKQRYPRARLWASVALRDADGRSRSTKVPADAWLDASDCEAAFERVLAVHPIEGAPKIGEVVFVHRPSRSLIVSDLLFHIDYPTNFMTRLALRLVGAHGGRLAQSRVWRASTRDRSAAGASVEAIFTDSDVASTHDGPIQRLIPAHGSILEAASGKYAEFQSAIRDALWW